MPVSPRSPVTPIAEQRFYEIDRLVRGHAFDIHNQFGRLLDEIVYKRELLRRCQASGLDILAEYKITFTLGAFEKDYFIDLLIENGVPLEVKAAKCISAQHRAQAMHYLFSIDQLHGILLNFRPASIEHEFISTTHHRESRAGYKIDATRWYVLCPEMETLREYMTGALAEWGALLDLQLYRDFLGFHFGGIKLVDILSEGQVIGQHKVLMIDEHTAFSVTAVTESPARMREHLRRCFRQTRLRAMAWINMNRLKISFETIDP